MAKKRRHRRVRMTDDYQCDLSLRLSYIQNALETATDALFDNEDKDTPRRVRSVPGMLMLAYKEVERINSEFSEIVFPKRSEKAPLVADQPTDGPRGPKLVVDNSKLN